MEDTPKARPEAPARDPFRQPRGSYDLFAKGENGHTEPPPSAPPPYEGPRWDDYDLGSPPPRSDGRTPDLSIIFVLIEALRRLVPSDLEGQFNSLLREVLKTLRALIDWYLERLDAGDSRPEVEDIPID